MHDIIVIGAGVSGCAVARELSRKKADILVVEREEDVCCGTTKATDHLVMSMCRLSSCVVGRGCLL